MAWVEFYKVTFDWVELKSSLYSNCFVYVSLEKLLGPVVMAWKHCLCFQGTTDWPHFCLKTAHHSFRGNQKSHHCSIFYILISTVLLSITLFFFVLLAIVPRSSSSTSHYLNFASRSANSEIIAGAVTVVVIFLIVVVLLTFFFKIYKSKYIRHKVNLSCFNNLGFVGC